MRRNAPIQMPNSGHVPHGIQFRVPWRIHQKAWEQYARLGHGEQSAERLAERGGFGLEELIQLLAGENPWGREVREDDTMASGSSALAAQASIDRQRISTLEAEQRFRDANEQHDDWNSAPCQRCHRPVIFEFTVTNEIWNKVVRSRKMPEYLCFWCFDELAGIGRIPVGINLNGITAFSAWCGDDVPGAYNEETNAEKIGRLESGNAFLRSEINGLQSELANLIENHNPSIKDGMKSTVMQSPIDMVLHCPQCAFQHVDAPDGEWRNPPHRSHLCGNCKYVWRPASVCTNGVRSVPPGSNDSTKIMVPLFERLKRIKQSLNFGQVE